MPCQRGPRSRRACLARVLTMHRLWTLRAVVQTFLAAGVVVLLVCVLSAWSPIASRQMVRFVPTSWPTERLNIGFATLSQGSFRSRMDAYSAPDTAPHRVLVPLWLKVGWFVLRTFGDEQQAFMVEASGWPFPALVWVAWRDWKTQGPVRMGGGILLTEPTDERISTTAPLAVGCIPEPVGFAVDWLLAAGCVHAFRLLVGAVADLVRRSRGGTCAPNRS